MVSETQSEVSGPTRCDSRSRGTAGGTNLIALHAIALVAPGPSAGESMRLVEMSVARKVSKLRYDGHDWYIVICPRCAASALDTDR